MDVSQIQKAVVDFETDKVKITSTYEVSIFIFQ